ncbi:hypothetical protein BQ8420_28485 [Nocardiopsis sp. JB363]|nr:hypothetical protein BQ8420_28485 [Nocardiopsis sp. JB363]
MLRGQGRIVLKKRFGQVHLELSPIEPEPSGFFLGTVHVA